MKTLDKNTNETRARATESVSETRARAARPKPRVSNEFLKKHVLPYSQDASEFIAELVQDVPTWADRLKYHSPAERAGLLVKAMRESAGLSQAKVEKHTQIRQSEISSIENGTGEKGPTYDVISRVADACGFYVTFASKSTPARSYSCFTEATEEAVSPADNAALVDAICTVLRTEGVLAEPATGTKTKRKTRNPEDNERLIQTVRNILADPHSGMTSSGPASRGAPSSLLKR